VYRRPWSCWFRCVDVQPEGQRRGCDAGRNRHLLRKSVAVACAVAVEPRFPRTGVRSFLRIVIDDALLAVHGAVVAPFSKSGLPINCCAPPLLTVTVTVLDVPTLLAASYALLIRVWEPLGTRVVFQG